LAVRLDRQECFYKRFNNLVIAGKSHNFLINLILSSSFERKSRDSFVFLGRVSGNSRNQRVCILPQSIRYLCWWTIPSCHALFHHGIPFTSDLWSAFNV